MEFDGSFNKKEIFMVGICCFLLGICLMISIQSQHISSNMSPQDWVKDKDISVYNNHVCFNATNLSWAGYKDTNSMLPTFDGTANGIETKPDSPESIKVGDVISFVDGKTIVVHRVIKTAYDKQGWFAKTKGDNNPIEDSSKIRFKNINGVLIALIY